MPHDDDATKNKSTEDVRKLQAELDARNASQKLEPPPVIRIVGGSLAENVEAAERALGRWGLLNPDQAIYQRSGLLMRIAKLSTKTDGAIRRPAGALHIVAVDPTVVALTLAKAAWWEKFDRRSNKWVPTDPSNNLALSLINNTGEWPTIPTLTGIIEAPTLRADGSVLSRTGYDAATGLFFNPGDTQFPPLESTTKDDAVKALAILKGLINDFPFVDETSRSVQLALMLTAMIRPQLRTAPLTAIGAPDQGSGKSLLASLPSFIASGRSPTMMSHTKNADEEKKVLLAILVEGSPVTIIDNISRPLESDALCSILTSPIWRERLLGSNKTVSVNTATTFVATGNNIRVKGDLSSRTLMCRIDPQCEKPEARSFERDLYIETPKQRGELAIACLTIIRAYLLSGESQKLSVFGRFEEWSRYVREPLVWLGCADPCDSREKVRSDDTIRQGLGALLETWEARFADRAVTVKEAMTVPDKLEDVAQHDALKDAMLMVADDGKGNVNARTLGNFISQQEARVEATRRFVRDGTSNRAVKWRVENLTPEEVRV